ncbi:PAS domain-containing sensor histidine kinase, partial [Sphingobacteriaceae bacterium AH-315-L07]|nr:PAS domain-containing sensor histidine kinase [Sphingobacteriaceae bacterium AH-315-L07]
RSNKDLREFSAIVSHDLKEPLRKIKFNSEQIINSDAKNKLNGEFQFVEKIKSTADRMDQLIKDLLAYSKVQTEQKDFEEVNLKEVVNGVLSDLEVRINEANGKIEVDEMPVIKADKLQMRQLFQNLISNAFKFHKESEPPVVTISSKKHADGAIEITVKDNGIGFDEKYAEKLFKPFQRLVSKSEYEGTGMGTAICKKIVEKHSGTINAKSSPNGGSTFTIKLPVLQ